MKTKKIIWMADEAIGNSRPSDWETILFLTKQLVDIVGNKDLEHEVVDPRICWRNLVTKIKDQGFTTVIDLSGFLSEALKELFPNATVVKDFKLSRIREISSHGLPTTGHLISHTNDQLRLRKQQLDLSRVLIVDDTSFSGTSNEITMDKWGLNPEKTSHAFLLANTGFFPGEGNTQIPGAVDKLCKRGSTVFWGQEIHTPTEDGWHTKDLHDHPTVLDAFEMSILIQQLANDGKLLDIQSHLRDPQTQRAIAADLFDFERLTQLHQEGRIDISRQINADEVHARNPLLWAIPAFGEHIDINQIKQHKEKVLHLLARINQCTTHPEGKFQAQEAFRQETMVLLGRVPEGAHKGKETL